MKTIHIFTEELSLKKVLEVILPKILPNDVSFRIYAHQGKQDLEQALKSTLPSLSKMPDSCILVTIDQDKDDCVALKNELFETIKDDCGCDFKIRIVCRELEAWFLGDMNAMEKAYPRFKAEQYVNKKGYRNIDKIEKPSKHILKLIPELSKQESLPKLEVSQSIAKYLDVNNNNSVSFRHTIDAIKKLTQPNI